MMMDRKWTKGSWSVSEARGASSEYWVCGGEGQSFGLVAEVIIPEDATLIAASPDLAEYVAKRAEEGDAEAIALWERING